MFTIEQAGSIKKVNTIDELIIEYIRQYACKCNSNSGGNLNSEELNSYLNNALAEALPNALKGVATEEYVNQVIKSIDLSEFVTYTTLEEYAKKDDIPTIHDDLVNNDTLATTLNDCAKQTSLDEYMHSIQASLDEYALKDDIITTENEYKVKNISLTLTEFALTSVFELDCFPEDGSVLKFEYDDTPYEFIWHIDATDERDAI